MKVISAKRGGRVAREEPNYVITKCSGERQHRGVEKTKQEEQNRDRISTAAGMHSIHSKVWAYLCRPLFGGVYSMNSMLKVPIPIILHVIAVLC